MPLDGDRLLLELALSVTLPALRWPNTACSVSWFSRQAANASRWVFAHQYVMDKKPYTSQ